MGVCAAGWVAWFPAGDPSSLMMVGVGDEAGRGGGGSEKSEGECEATKRPDRARQRFIERERETEGGG